MWFQAAIHLKATCIGGVFPSSGPGQIGREIELRIPDFLQQFNLVSDHLQHNQRPKILRENCGKTNEVYPSQDHHIFNRDFSFLLLSGVLASLRYICVASLSDKKGKRFINVTYEL